MRSTNKLTISICLPLTLGISSIVYGQQKITSGLALALKQEAIVPIAANAATGTMT